MATVEELHDEEIARSRQLRQWEPWKVVIAAMTAGAALLTAGAVMGGLIVSFILRGHQ